MTIKHAQTDKIWDITWGTLLQPNTCKLAKYEYETWHGDHYCNQNLCGLKEHETTGPLLVKWKFLWSSQPWVHFVIGIAGVHYWMESHIYPFLHTYRTSRDIQSFLCDIIVIFEFFMVMSVISKLIIFNELNK